jgi:MFS family permease
MLPIMIVSFRPKYSFKMPLTSAKIAAVPIVTLTMTSSVKELRSKFVLSRSIAPDTTPVSYPNKNPPIAGILNEYLGRKLTIIIGSMVFTVGAVVLAVAQNTGMLIAGRAILGIGIGKFRGYTCTFYKITRTSYDNGSNSFINISLMV